MKPAKNKAAARAYHHGDLRRALIECTARLASREGVAAVSLRRVAAAAGVSPAAPYHHFKNKADLLAAVAEEGFRLLDRAMTRAAAKAPPAPLDQMQAMGGAYVRFAARYPQYFRVMFRPELAAAAVPDPDSWGQRAYHRLIHGIQALLGEAGPPSEAVMAEVVYAWSVVHGLATLWVDGTLSSEPPFKDWGIDGLIAAITSRAGPMNT